MSESQNIEWKRSWHDDYLKWVCGFANAVGGTIYIGKDDDGVLTHLENHKALMEALPNKIRENLGIICDVNLHDEAGKKYIEIKVNPYSVPVSLRGRYYYRSGSSKMEMTGNTLNEFLLKKAGKTWDDVIEEGASLNDIDDNSIKTFVKDALKSGRMSNDIGELSTVELLEKIRLLDHGKLKRAAIILFGKDPNRFYPNIKVKIGRFGVNDADLRFQEVEEGNIMELLKTVPNQLNYKFFTKPIDFEGLLRIEKDEYPVAAIREMLLNALVHRSYMGSMIQLRVYDTKLTIWNEGLLPEGMELESLKRHHISRPRNPLIADVCFKAGYIDSWGRGTLKIYEACKEAGLPEPEITSLDGGILVTVFKKTIQSPTDQVDDQAGTMKSIEELQKEFGLLTDRITLGQEKNIAFLRGNYGVFTEEMRTKYGRSSDEIRTKFGEKTIYAVFLILLNNSITANEIGKVLGVTQRTIEKYIGILKSDFIIERIGADKGGHWKIIEQK
ncbi:ATP-binding protein [Flavobacterium gawalongense]|uniref:HTH domain-containing protein n=1 Tax=Flavobacterium gawalongense TaxID=2594432 RepID=A0ABY3CPV1_9FLAO|nr:ATP-binding protein [Flavobacterium gawalongense]TRX03216.1 HTH domain-containing protein [Flavobacterium gawalongense]TRX09878.1 HTH domain-containing protein [Flavobacterium gawalongense]